MIENFTLLILSNNVSLACQLTTQKSIFYSLKYSFVNQQFVMSFIVR